MPTYCVQEIRKHLLVKLQMISLCERQGSHPNLVSNHGPLPTASPISSITIGLGFDPSVPSGAVGAPPMLPLSTRPHGPY